ncbi:HEAT repeat domain-containing protein [Larkinella soli]|uniref:HEAT repeat domain-containing protein n=1 Tax=Larkinella soli TaxID=1770527 RepID=UPI000FFC2E76|nr:HEAT repeat domain-containing protein [Larkinella soli]
MNCEHSRNQLVDLLGNQLAEAERITLEVHLAQCPDCREELAATRRLWQAMGRMPVPEPTEKMRVRFYAMVETYKDAEAAKRRRSLKSVFRRIRRALTPQLALRLAYSLLLVGAGLAGGYWLSARNAPAVAYERQIDALSTQVQEMHQTVLLSLLENPSASERLRAIGYTREIGQVDRKVTEALLSTLNNDPNVNVRLVTLEALAQLADDPKVREGLVQSITQQDSPLVQAALADVMVKLQEKRSVRPLKQLLHQENVDDLVKTKIKESIKALS